MDHLHFPRLRRKSQASSAVAAELKQGQSPPSTASASAPATALATAPAMPPIPRSSGVSLIPVPTNATASSVNSAATTSTSQSAKSRAPSSLKKSTLRTLRFNSAKRARSPQMPQIAPPPVAVVHHEPSTALEGGGVSLGSSPSANASSPRKRRMPAFLNQSIQDMMWKFADLQFIEANRSGAAERSQNPNHRWAVYNIGRPRRASMALDRYSNIKPWNYNRVRLHVPSDTMDYVNASLVTVPSTSNPSLEPHRYIAMQGPTPASLDFVWRMIAEQAQVPESPPPSPVLAYLSTPASSFQQLTPKSSPSPASAPGPIVIVQLTKMVENGVSKCHTYFPSTAPHHDSEPLVLNETDRWGDGWRATVTFDGTEVLENGAIEKTRLLLHVQGEEQPRVVWHFLYQSWPDFGVPANSDVGAFFSLMRLSREYNTAGNRRIIHCSAGVGRTGTFMALEHLMRELEIGALENVPDFSQKEPESPSHRINGGGVSLSPPPPPSPAELDPIFATVDLLRSQRKQMVQAEAQFAFIYRVLRVLWLEKYWGRSSATQGEQDEPARKRLGVEDPFVE